MGWHVAGANATWAELFARSFLRVKYFIDADESMGIFHFTNLNLSRSRSLSMYTFSFTIYILEYQSKEKMIESANRIECDLNIFSKKKKIKTN